MTTSLSVFTGSTAVLDVPILQSSTSAPTWVTSRGGDVRAYDNRQGVNVYGPGHTFQVEQDIRVSNGILRFDVGARNLTPYLAVGAYKGGAWRAKGYLLFSAANTLAGARLLTVTPERACVVLSTRNEGEVYVWLHRGERMLRITHGSLRAPSLSCVRVVYWWGTAPALTGGWGRGPWGSTPWGGSGSPDPGEIDGSLLTSGLVYETTTDGGSTRVTDGNGLTRGVCVLRNGATKLALGVQRTTLSYDVGAFIATAATGDDLADQHAQLACASEQTTRLR